MPHALAHAEVRRLLLGCITNPIHRTRAPSLPSRERGSKQYAHDQRPDLVAPAAAWAKPWVVHINHWGQGHQAVLRYLARYVFRVAITNTRIVALDDHTVTIRYKQRKSSRRRTSRMHGNEFVRRFLQHVLPKGMHKSHLQNCRSALNYRL